MKIQFDDKQIRIRISEEEFCYLKEQRKLTYQVNYLPLNVTISVVENSESGIIVDQSLYLRLTVADLALLAIPESKKSGLKLWVVTATNEEIVADLQVDLHSK